MSDTIKAGRETDALVAEKVMEWPLISEDDAYRHYADDHGGVVVAGTPQRFTGVGIIPRGWSPSTDIASAWEVVEKLEADYDVSIYRESGQWCVDITRSTCDNIAHQRQWSGYTETAPLAICIAALRAVGADVEESE